MNKKISTILICINAFCIQSIFAEESIQVQTLLTLDAINCESPNPMQDFLLNYYSAQKSENKPVLKGQRFILNDANYRGINAVKTYPTKYGQQTDFSVNFNQFTLPVIKISVWTKGYAIEQSDAYYIVFKGKPSQVSKALKQQFSTQWKTSDRLTQTPQGNTRLQCEDITEISPVGDMIE
ncbi:hypothetical protein BEN71_18925 [Acinetobacter wuhouensis]|uniref:hypothetical protein n=1 Tax=Acinetobacter wuhouensis TaxID=1879050 RepID=UPI00083AC543|nr:hypothetical protein [Acinetobacter wuhouensis]AXQ23993.1 hypothetical protein BEN71_18925 [Acinetobacter wuhouensis]